MNNKDQIKKFIGSWLILQYECFLMDVLETIQKGFDEGKSFDDIKLGFDYLPDSIGFEGIMEAKGSVIQLMNECVADLLQIADANRFLEIIGQDIKIDEKGIKDALDAKLKPKSNLIILH